MSWERDPMSWERDKYFFHMSPQCCRSNTLQTANSLVSHVCVVVLDGEPHLVRTC